jgi:hypothetical protein
MPGHRAIAFRQLGGRDPELLMFARDYVRAGRVNSLTSNRCPTSKGQS